MKLSPLSLALGLAATASACSSSDSDVAATTGQQLPAAALAATTPPLPTTPARPMPPTKPAPYELRGILDPGLQNMVAFAVKIPRGWHLAQSFTRKWNGSTPIGQVSLRISAPDGKQQLDFLPERPYFFNDGPTARNLRQTAASMGLPAQPTSPYELAPMPALSYIQHVLLPDLARQGFPFRAGSGHEGLRRATSSTTSETTAYVDGQLPNGRLARVECLLRTTATNVNGEVFYNWTALPSITQAATDLDATFALTQVVRHSVLYNPVWERQNQQLVRNGQVADNEILRRDVAAQKAYHDNQIRNRDELARQRGESQDAIAKARGDQLIGRADYQNPTTGERTRTDDKYNYVYQDRHGELFGSNTPLDATRLDWQELQRLEATSPK